MTSLTKPIDRPELNARVRSLVRLKRFTDDLDSAEAVLRSLALMVEARDAYTQDHCERLAQYATELGEALQLPEDDLVTLARGGYFHDIGKIALPDAILLKPTDLTPEEYERVKEHPVIGDRLCGNLRVLHRVRPIVRHHHERLDGSGYPDGLSGDAVPLLAQIISIVDRLRRDDDDEAVPAGGVADPRPSKSSTRKSGAAGAGAISSTRSPHVYLARDASFPRMARPSGV